MSFDGLVCVCVSGVVGHIYFYVGNEKKRACALFSHHFFIPFVCLSSSHLSFFFFFLAACRPLYLAPVIFFSDFCPHSSNDSLSVLKQSCMGADREENWLTLSICGPRHPAPQNTPNTLRDTFYLCVPLPCAYIYSHQQMVWGKEEG